MTIALTSDIKSRISIKINNMLYFIYIKTLIILTKMQGREETAEERRERWMAKEAEKAVEGGRKVKKIKCSKCGQELDEFVDVRGRTLCFDCYAMEEERFSIP